MQQRHTVAVGLLAALAILTSAGFLIWTAVLDADDASDASPDLVSVARSTLTARAESVPPSATPRPTDAPPPAATREPDSTATELTTAEACAADPLAEDLVTGVPVGSPTAAYSKWYGNRESGIWAAPADFGVLLPGGPGADASELWFAEGTLVQWYGSPVSIQLSGRQLDGDAILEPVTGSNPFNLIQWIDVSLPEPGCWELVAVAGERSLSLTVEVLPLSQRPDIAYSERYYAARAYEEPASCPITPWTGPEIRGDGNFAHYWLEGDGISTEVPGMFIANTSQTIGIFGADVADGLSVTARSLDVGATNQMDITTSLWNDGARLATYELPAPGCWELQLETATLMATFVIYAYPEDCEPEFQDGEFLVACEPPQS